jgi:hypothetical protein
MGVEDLAAPPGALRQPSRKALRALRIPGLPRPFYCPYPFSRKRAFYFALRAFLFRFPLDKRGRINLKYNAFLRIKGEKV